MIMKKIYWIGLLLLVVVVIMWYRESFRPQGSTIGIRGIIPGSGEGSTYTPIAGVASNLVSRLIWTDVNMPIFSLEHSAGSLAWTETFDPYAGQKAEGFNTTVEVTGMYQTPSNLATTNGSLPVLYIPVHVHYSVPHNHADQTNITWQMVWEWANPGGLFSLPQTNLAYVYGLVLSNSTSSSVGSITNIGMTPGSIIRFKFKRKYIADGTDYGASDLVLVDSLDFSVPIK